MSRGRAAAVLALGLAALAAGPAAASSIAPAGCLQAPGVARGCTEAIGLEGAAAAVVSPDGRNVYVAGSVEEHGALVTFARDPATGALTEQGCLADDDRDGCTPSEALFGANDVAISADGATVYALGVLPGSVGVFRRDAATGALTEVQCFQEGYDSPTGCPRTRFENVWKFALTPDGKSLIVAGSDITRFAVGADGLLSGPVQEHVSGLSNPTAIAVGPDPRRVFVAGGYDDYGKVSVIARNPATGALTAHGCAGDGSSSGRLCAKASAVRGPADLAVSPDGRGVYLAATWFTSSNPADPFSFAGTLHSSALSALSPANGTQTACMLFTGAERERGRCHHGASARGPGFAGASAIAITPDGRAAVAGFAKSSAVAILGRDPGTQKLGVPPGKAGCVRDPGRRSRLPRGCAVGKGIHQPTDVAISPDGRNAYVTTPGGLSMFAIRTP
ncbi:MAG: conserved repeat protein [Solirubrobacterales bacterium]|nr:conserved repeat protein [Solirubrobacterales bacterium]